VSTPGPGGPQPPEQDPRQPGQPASWGQQPPAGQPYPGQPYPGQQPPAGQPWGAPQQPGYPQAGYPQQPGTPQPFGATGAQAFGAPAPQKPKRRWLPIVGGVIALIVVLSALTNLLGGGDPKVGDCIQQTGDSNFETVDCDSSDAERKVVGIDDDMTGDEFRDAPAEQLCTDFPDTTFVLWSGSDESEDGHVYCTTDV
jgi:hypothetical protein